MEHTDAGAHVVLADIHLPEPTYGGPGGIPPSPPRPRPAERAAVSLAGAGQPGPAVERLAEHVGGAAGAGDAERNVVTEGNANLGDISLTIRDDHAGVSPFTEGDDPGQHDAAAAADDDEPGSAPAGAPAVRLAPVVDLGLTDMFPEPMEWQERALCAQTDPEAFFPEKGGSTREAKRICAGCEVRPECLEYALANDERFGIWGGMSERERRKQRRRAV